MASIVEQKLKNGTRRSIQFVSADGKRRTLRLGNVTKADAESIKIHVQRLISAQCTNNTIHPETERWLINSEWPDLLDKLSAPGVGLIPERKPEEVVTLKCFLDQYIAGRTDSKPGTHINYDIVRRNLVEKFGEAKPLAEINVGDAKDFRRWLAGTLGLALNTVRRRVGIAKQFFQAAKEKRLIQDTPFGAMKDVHVKPIRAKDHFVSREDAALILAACPSARWRAIFALARFGGLRCPSEVLKLKVSDIDWKTGRMTVHSPKTEHHEGKESRVIPIFPELRPYLEEACQEATAAGSDFIISKFREPGSNKRTTLTKIIKNAGLKPWKKLFQNLRQTRAIELAGIWPLHVAAEWMGHDALVAQKHYWRVTDDDFAKALKTQPDAQPDVSDQTQYQKQHASALERTIAQILGKVLESSELVMKECDRVRLNALLCASLQEGLNCPSRI